MAKSEPHLDVLVLGEHPSAYLAAALLRVKTKFRVQHVALPDEHPGDRLVVINPKFFELHALLGGMIRKLDLTAVYGLRFLADDPATASEFRSKAALGFIGSYKDVRAAMLKLAEEQGVELLTPRSVRIHHLDEQGVEVSLGKAAVRPKALVLAGRLEADQGRLLGIPDHWEPGVLHRYSFARIKGGKAIDWGARPTVPMSLDLGGRLMWAWLFNHGSQAQLAVEQPAETVEDLPPVQLLRHWADVLHRHGVLPSPAVFTDDAVQTIDLPLGGALAHEGVANRTLLVGPAGGFYSACGEDIFPNCWSAVHAAESLKRALKEPHLQDALNSYRARWRTTLGDYLRGPQQNLRFLLPLIYRNEVMTARLSESILLGKSVIR